MNPALLIVIGASGAGKTAAVRRLDVCNRPGLHCYFFDSIGVPSEEEMVRDFGSGEGWQAAATRRWVDRLATETAPGEVSLLEGQTRPSFVRDALGPYTDLVTSIVLFDCAAEVRATRLADRGQPELNTPRMESWAAYLREQAGEFGLPIIDTTHLSIEAAADALAARVDVLRLVIGCEDV